MKYICTVTEKETGIESLCSIDGDDLYSTETLAIAKGVKFEMENSCWGADNFYRVYSLEEIK
jgi:hypothetical protein